MEENFGEPRSGEPTRSLCWDEDSYRLGGEGMGELTTGASTTTHCPKIAIPGHRRRSFELFV